METEREAEGMKTYEIPELEIIQLESADVIMTSPGGVGDDTGEWL